MYQNVAVRNGIDRSILMFDDTITIYNKISDTEWKRTVVDGVQWADKTERKNEGGKISIAKYISITFPEGTYEGLLLDSLNREDCILFGEITEEITGEKGRRVSDLLQKYPKSGRIISVNDNTNRGLLKNIKVVLE